MDERTSGHKKIFLTHMAGQWKVVSGQNLDSQILDSQNLDNCLKIATRFNCFSASRNPKIS